RHGLPPLEPEIEEVAEQMDLLGILGRLIQKGTDPLLADQAAGRIGHAEVEIAEEMDALARLHASRRSPNTGHGRMPRTRRVGSSFSKAMMKRIRSPMVRSRNSSSSAMRSEM